MANLASSTGADAALRKRIDVAHAETAQPLSREEVSEILWSIVASMEGDLSATDLKLYNELDALARYIESTKAEIASIRPDEICERHLPTAHDELDAVIEHTEAATNTIMDACDAITAVAGGLDAEKSNALIDQVTRIFEACNFQDVTGQRITKVVKALQHIETKVTALVQAFGEELERAKLAVAEAEAAVEAPAPTPAPADAVDDSFLLHGPQLPSNAIDQDEIDRLLASFG